jgi:hypothetical protein
MVTAGSKPTPPTVSSMTVMDPAAMLAALRSIRLDALMGGSMNLSMPCAIRFSCTCNALASPRQSMAGL